MASRKQKSSNKNLLPLNSLMNGRVEVVKRLSIKMHQEVELLYNLKIFSESLLKQIDELQGNLSGNSDKEIDYFQEVKKFEISLIYTALAKTNGSQSKAAKLLNLKTSTLCEKMKRFGILP